MKDSPSMDLLLARECCASQAVRIYMEEKGLPYRMCNIDLALAENLEPAFLKLNPDGSTPVLVDGNTVVTGIVSLMHYFDQVGGRLGGSSIDRKTFLSWTDKLLPHLEDEVLAYSLMPRSRARMLIRYKRSVCIRRLQTAEPKLRHAYGTLLTKYELLDMKVCAGHAVEVEKKELGRLFAEIDRFFLETGQGYLAGADISMADIMLAVLLAKAQSLGMEKDLLKTHMKLREYWEHWQKRESYHKVFNPTAQAAAKAAKVGAIMLVQGRMLTERFH